MVKENIDQCPSFNSCEAPLCPLHDGLDDAVWYPDEPICGSIKHKQPWIKKQRKIRKYTTDPDRGYFTVNMLQAITKVQKGIKGINPEYDASPDVWATARKSKQKPTPTSTMPVFAGLTPRNKATDGYNHVKPYQTIKDNQLSLL